MAIPIASVGANRDVAEAIRNLLLPEYDVTHTCLDIGTALSELPAICSGQLETEISSGLGTNVERPISERLPPRAIVFGGGVPDDQVVAVTGVVHATAPNVKTVRVTREDIASAGADGPNPEVITEVLRKKLSEISL
ncbi:Matrilin-4 [Madurella mycetomatis]|uniref:Matrilin-4 n=1 Tax=Madurella mycetomatis TaxID=100816 RepID=A0A175VV50_9PEZI|nr:Matrilin-4 [Madurella mycetomatis]